MKRLQTLVLLLGFSFFYHQVWSQENAVSSFGDISGSGGSATLSIGQVHYSSSGEVFSIAAGVQQAYERFITGTVVVIEHHSGELLICENLEDQWTTFLWYRNDIPVFNLNYYYEEGGLSGTYYVVVTDANGTEYTSESYIYAETRSSSVGLVVYPVPVLSDANLNLYFTDADRKVEDKVQMSLYNESGKLVFQSMIVVGINNTIDLPVLKPGYYVLKIENEATKILVK